MTSPGLSTGYENILVEASGRVARLVLNKPPQNALTVKMMQEIAHAIESLHAAREIRAIVIEAAPGSTFFSVGVAPQDAVPGRAFQMMEAFQGIFKAMLEISKPLITVINGPAVGAGCELALFGDLVLATEKARFAQPEVRTGVFPPIAAILLPHLIGPKRTMEMILLAEPISHLEAHRLGLVNRLIPEAKLAAEVDAILARITDQSSAVLEMTKRVMFDSMGYPLHEAFKRSADLYLNQLMDLEDAQEGLLAVAERRKPVWKNK